MGESSCRESKSAERLGKEGRERQRAFELSPSVAVERAERKKEHQPEGSGSSHRGMVAVEGLAQDGTKHEI